VVFLDNRLIAIKQFWHLQEPDAAGKPLRM